MKILNTAATKRILICAIFATGFFFYSCKKEDDNNLQESDDPTPTALIAVGGDSHVNLNWEGNTNANYSILRGTNAGSTVEIANNIKGTNYTDNALTNGKNYYYVVSFKNDKGSSISNEIKVTPLADESPGSVKWPLSASVAADADGIRYPMGARFFGGEFDFHAGVDIPAPLGTIIYPVLDGIVTKIQLWDGVTKGPGNYVLVKHGNTSKWTNYQHMDNIASGLTVGQTVTAGKTILGHVGHSGADKDHLHFNYMIGLTSETTSESKAHNPLELLPYTPPTTLLATFRADGSSKVDVQLSTHMMTLRWVIVKGSGQTRMADYYEIVSQGSSNRNNQNQSGLHFEVTELVEPHPTAKVNFTLTISPDLNDSFRIEQVILKDFKGSVLADVKRK